MRGILHHRERITLTRRLPAPWQSGSKGNWKQPSSFKNNLYELLIIKLIYLNVGGVSDHDARRRTAAATVGARLVGVRMPSYALSGARGGRFYFSTC